LIASTGIVLAWAIFREKSENAKSSLNKIILNHAHGKDSHHENLPTTARVPKIFFTVDPNEELSIFLAGINHRKIR
jgi:hypothetical protein